MGTPTSTPPVCPPVTTSSTTSSATELESDAGWPAGARMRSMEPSSLDRKKLPYPLCHLKDVTARRKQRLTTRDREQETGSSSTPARFVPEERLARMPALEMEDHLWYVRLSLEDGPWWVWSPGVWAVGLTPLVSTLRWPTSETGSMPTKDVIKYSNQ